MESAHLSSEARELKQRGALFRRKSVIFPRHKRLYKWNLQGARMPWKKQKPWYSGRPSCRQSSLHSLAPVHAFVRAAPRRTSNVERYHCFCTLRHYTTFSTLRDNFLLSYSLHLCRKTDKPVLHEELAVYCTSITRSSQEKHSLL